MRSRWSSDGKVHTALPAGDWIRVDAAIRLTTMTDHQLYLLAQKQCFQSLVTDEQRYFRYYSESELLAFMGKVANGEIRISMTTDRFIQKRYFEYMKRRNAENAEADNTEGGP